ncbi:MAG: DUF1295 domain-containing protein [Desulfobulbaceae bacterium]|nr:DUF1295 domain-containing protein [Desulfobulbaceae bacterium]
MHSLLIEPSIVVFLKSRCAPLRNYYRLYYNLISLVTLIPLVILSRIAGGEVVLLWDGWGNVFRLFLLFCTFALFYGGAQRYDLLSFLGVSQMRTGEEQLLLSEDVHFYDTGVFGMTRHPWYLGSLCLIWSALPAYPAKSFAVASILSIYLIVGTMLEERKIMSLYGDLYGEYRAKVSMLFPWKWLVRKIFAHFPGFR